MFKVSNKNTIDVINVFLSSYSYFTPFFSISLVFFEQVNVSGLSFGRNKC